MQFLCGNCSKLTQSRRHENILTESIRSYTGIENHDLFVDDNETARKKILMETRFQCLLKFNQQLKITSTKSFYLTSAVFPRSERAILPH